MAARQSRAERRRAAREIARKQVRRPPPIAAAPPSAIGGDVSPRCLRRKTPGPESGRYSWGWVEIRVSWRPVTAR